MKKLNFRPLFYGLIAFCIAMLLSSYVFEQNISKIVFIGIVVLATIICCIYFKQYKRLCYLLLAFVLGFSYYFVAYTTFSAKEYQNEVNIEARVCEISEYAGYSIIVLDDVKVNNTEQNFKISAQISDISVDVGNVICFDGTLINIKLFEDGEFNSFAYKNKTQYRGIVRDILSISDGYKKPNEVVVSYVKDITSNNFSKDIAEIVNTIFVGDKTSYDNEIKDTFSIAGISHLLAISGLHVSIIIMSLSFILDRLKTKRVLKFAILFVILAVYTYICNFSPSVIRASIMSLTFVFASCLGKKYDKINALSLSAILYLLISPLGIFDAGFLLSYFCVFSIFVLYKPFEKFIYNHICKKISKPLAIALSVWLGILPITLVYYNSVNVLSVIFNLVCVPVFEAVFVLVFVLITLVCVLPFMSFLLEIVEVVFAGYVYLVKMFASITFLAFETSTVPSFIILPTYSSIFVASRYINIQKILKAIIILLIASFALLCLFFA